MTCRADLIDAIVEVCGLSPEVLVDDATLDELEIDSIDLIELAMIMETKYSAEFSVDDFSDVKTLAEAVAIFDQAIAAA